MRELSTTGRQAIQDIAQRHGFSIDATLSMLEAVIDGAGSMAQFNHPEFAGSGQWMRGGMTMVSDMFNHRLKGQVDALCLELADLVARQPDLVPSASFQAQRQSGAHGTAQQHSGGTSSQQQQGAGRFGAASLFVPPAPGTSGDWWPGGMGRPSSVGAQNGVRYAYFEIARRLVIDVGGKVSVYDTLDHRITGFSQQQSAGGSLSFTSQHGLIDVASLPLVSATDQGLRAPAQAPGAPQPARTAPRAAEHDVFEAIEKLAGLKARGILSDEEFAAKKAELLKRI